MIKTGDERVLLYYADPICSVRNSPNVRRNGTFPRILENRTVVNIQRYICMYCGNSFGVGPPSHGYGKHYPTDIRHKSLKGRVKTALRKTASFFLNLLSVSNSHETARMNMPPSPHRIMDSEGYFIYYEHYVHIGSTEKHRAPLKDSRTGNFVKGDLNLQRGL